MPRLRREHEVNADEIVKLKEEFYRCLDTGLVMFHESPAQTIRVVHALVTVVGDFAVVQHHDGSREKFVDCSLKDFFVARKLG